MASRRYRVICERCTGYVEAGSCLCTRREFHLENIRTVAAWVDQNLDSKKAKLKAARVGSAVLARSRRLNVSSDESRREERLGWAIAYQDADPGLKPKHVEPRSLPQRNVYTEII